MSYVLAVIREANMPRSKSKSGPAGQGECPREGPERYERGGTVCKGEKRRSSASKTPSPSIIAATWPGGNVSCHDREWSRQGGQ